MIAKGISKDAVEKTCYKNALLAYGQSGQISESDWLESNSSDQKILFEGNSVLRGQVEPQRNSSVIT